MGMVMIIINQHHYIAFVEFVIKKRNWNEHRLMATSKGNWNIFQNANKFPVIFNFNFFIFGIWNTTFYISYSNAKGKRNYFSFLFWMNGHKNHKIIINAYGIELWSLHSWNLLICSSNGAKKKKQKKNSKSFWIVLFNCQMDTG